MNLLFCAYCGAQISEKVSHCSACGATTETAYYIDRKENNSSYKKVGNTRTKFNDVNFNDLLDQYGLFTDFRLINKGDNNFFNVNQNDIFVCLKNNRNKTQRSQNFKGQICVFQEYEKFDEKNIIKLFPYLLSALPNKFLDGNLNVNGFSQSMFIQISQRVTAWNMGRQSVRVGTQRAISSILPENTNFRFTLNEENKITYIQSLCGYSIIAVPEYFDKDNPFSQGLSDNEIYFISPSQQKLLAIVSDDEYLENVGYGASCSSIYGVIHI